MITVYAWNANVLKGSFGHISLALGSTYISYWPQEKKIQAAPDYNRSFEDDMQAYNNSLDFNESIRGLDEQALLNWWRLFSPGWEGSYLVGRPTDYNLFTSSCAVVVLEALCQGGSEKYVPFYSPKVAVTPWDVKRYVRQLQRKIQLPPA